MKQSQRHFTFGVLCYNEERLIAETLESIRYQVVMHGGDRATRLIIADDCSTDGTQDVIKEWVTRRGNPFASIELLFNEQNLGVVSNYNTILTKIEDEPFKVIAGDDLIASYDIFEHADNLRHHTLDVFFPLILCEGHVYPDYARMREYFIHITKPQSKDYDLRMFRRRLCGSYISAPSALFDIETYRNAGAPEATSQFRLIEDAPTWYSIINNLADSRVRFQFGSITLYRKRSESLSQSSKLSPEYAYEIGRLIQMFERDSGWFERLYIRSQNAGLPIMLRLDKYVNLLHKLRLRLYCLVHRREYERFKAEVEASAREQQAFYDRIYELAHRDGTGVEARENDGNEDGR